MAIFLSVPHPQGTEDSLEPFIKSYDDEGANAHVIYAMIVRGNEER